MNILLLTYMFTWPQIFLKARFPVALQPIQLHFYLVHIRQHLVAYTSQKLSIFDSPFAKSLESSKIRFLLMYEVGTNVLYGTNVSDGHSVAPFGRPGHTTAPSSYFSAINLEVKTILGGLKWSPINSPHPWFSRHSSKSSFAMLHCMMPLFKACPAFLVLWTLPIHSV